MIPFPYLVGLAVLAVALIWPLSIHGYRYYLGLVEVENAKHQKQSEDSPNHH